MKVFRKRRPGSMFKRFFILMTVTVLFCLSISSFSLLFFVMNFWKTDRFTSLSDDALSLAQSVQLMYSDPQMSFTTDESAQSSLLLIAGALSSIAETSDSEVFLANTNGRIFMCKDKITYSPQGIELTKSCALHDHIVFSDEIMNELLNSTEDVYNYQGTIDGFSDDEYLLAAVPVYRDGMINCFVFSLQSVSVAYLPYTTEFARMLIIASLIAVAISFVSSLIVSYRMVKPMKKITEATDHYASGDFTVRINATDTYNELAVLCESINSMANNLAIIEESRSNFVANVSHELKTPMTIISGFVDGILDGTIHEADRERYLGIVSGEVKRLSRLVIAMLNMSKIEAGKLVMKPTDVKLGEMLVRTLMGFEKVISEQEINVMGLDTIDSVVINADDALINQVIYNLIDNAVKFTPYGGTITISLSTDKKFAVMKIRNTGKGIPEEDCTLVFDRFYKVDKSRGLDSKSFGMGLYIVKSIIELHHGTISINSTVDEYTEFVVKLPL